MNDRLNPIFVFEIRQVVRNRLVLAALCIYLFLLIGILVWKLFDALLTSGYIGLDEQLGSELTATILQTLGGFTLPLLLIYSATTTIEQGLNQELLFQTPVDHAVMGRGKLFAGSLLCLLFYVVTLPALTFSWMLRGVDIVQLLGALLSMFLLTQTVNLYGIAALLRCRTSSHLAGALGGLLFASPPLLGIAIYLIVGPSGMIRQGWGGGTAGVLIPLFWSVMTSLMMTLAMTEMFRMNWRPSASVFQRFGVSASFSWLGIFLTGFIGLGFFIPGMMVLGLLTRLGSLLF